MAELIRFEYRRAAEDADEVIAVQNDGAVRRSVTGAGSGAAAIGWWRGAVDESVLATIRAARGSAPPTGPAPVPSAVGAWWAVLDDHPRRTDAGDAALASLQSVCAAAATDAETVVRATAWTETWDGEPAPIVMLRLRGDGDTPGNVCFDDRPDAPVAAFVTDAMETLGFLGSTFTITPPVEASSVLRERPLADGRLWLTGSLARAGTEPIAGRLPEEQMQFRLVVDTADGPPPTDAQ